MYILSGCGRGKGGSGAANSKDKTHPKPSSKRIEHVSFATLSGHFKVGCMVSPLSNTLRGFCGLPERPFQHHLLRVLGDANLVSILCAHPLREPYGTNFGKKSARPAGPQGGSVLKATHDVKFIVGLV